MCPPVCQAAVLYLQFASDFGVVQRTLASSTTPSTTCLASVVPQAPFSGEDLRAPDSQPFLVPAVNCILASCATGVTSVPCAQTWHLGFGGDSDVTWCDLDSSHFTQAPHLRRGLATGTPSLFVFQCFTVKQSHFKANTVIRSSF